MRGKPTTIDDYLETLDNDKRAALTKLRKDILAAVPGVEECISYSMPGFRLDGRMLAWFGAASRHCAFYPGAAPIEACKEALAKYETSKGTVRFPPEKPLPAALVRKLLKVRTDENRARARRRATREAAGSQPARAASRRQKAPTNS